jgi:opacity protein-like surface antigen
MIMMKKSAILSALFILLYSAAFSQEQEEVIITKEKNSTRQTGEIQTLLGNHQPGGGYGAFSFGYSSIDNRNAVLFGGKVAWIASHFIGFGFGGTGFINEFHYEPLLDRDVALTGGYGGLYIEPILMPRFPVHMSFPVLFGAGGISYVSKNPDQNNNLIEDSEAFLLIEPGAELEMNLTRHFRFACGVSYRFPTPFDVGTTGSAVVSSESLKGLSYTITFKFGKF